MPTPKAGSGLRILLVEDDLAIQFGIVRLLEKCGYLMTVANNGLEALEFLAIEDFDLILMDCMMPAMNGYEATSIIRDGTSKVRNHSIPIIAITGNELNGGRDKCLTAGMDDYLSKPTPVADLLAMIDKWSTSDVTR